ncbi:MAG: hypothetical protein WA691_01080 [Thermoplasmata archaeon]
MLGYVTKKPRKKDEVQPPELRIPPDLRRRLAAWVDVDEVGPEGFWLWLRAILPLLPTPASPERGQVLMNVPRTDDVRELRQRLVVYAREHSRLSVVRDHYARDNQVLARRLKALEAALRTLEMAGAPVVIPADDDAGEVSEQYLRQGKGR